MPLFCIEDLDKKLTKILTSRPATLRDLHLSEHKDCVNRLPTPSFANSRHMSSLELWPQAGSVIKSFAISDAYKMGNTELSNL